MGEEITFKTEEQKIVVESRVMQGYIADMLHNGNVLLTKGKHTMEINSLGYDCYTPSYNIY